MEKRTFKPGTMLSPVPAVMVSCGSCGGEKNIITVAWTGNVNSDPPMTYISVRKSRYSHSMIAESGRFVINLCSRALAETTDYCGVKSGRDVDKFKARGLTAIRAQHSDCPMIAEAPVNIECKVIEVHEYPSHDMFVAEVEAVHADESLMDGHGKLCLEKAGLVAYCHGEYFALDKSPLGQFGFSVMKPKTKKRLAGQRRAARKRKR